MRVLLFTGKGGVGKTTVAAATATLAARNGLKTLVVSTDPAHSLLDALGTGMAARPGRTVETVEIDTGLFVGEVDTRRRLEGSWRRIQDYLLALLDAAGVDPVAAEEVTVLPGVEEVLTLLELRDHARSGRYDVVVLDCAPTAETLRLLALPDALQWYLDRVVPLERRLVRTLRPLVGAAVPQRWREAGLPVPTVPPHDLVDGVQRLRRDLADARELLTSTEASVRLVLTPEAVVVAEARRTLTSLSLYGYRVDAVVANRVFPADTGDPWRSRWAAAHAACLDDVVASFAPLPIYRSPYRPWEPVGLPALAELAADVYGDDDPVAPPDPVRGSDLLTVERSAEGFVLSLALPLADRRDLGLARAGDELVVTVGPHRRVLALPSALRRCAVEGAGLRDGRLHVRFAPDPTLWRNP